MHKYRVIESHSDPNRLLLEGGVGRYHWARVLNHPPRVGDFLSGSRPHLGFGLLQCSQSSRTIRVIFESINSFGKSRHAEPFPASQQGAPADQ